MMRYATTDIFLKYYLSKRVSVDARAIVHGLKPQDTLMRAASRMSRSIDPRRLYEPTKAQMQSIEKQPRVVKLVAIRDNLRPRFVGTIKSNVGTKLYNRYTKVVRQIVNERQRQGLLLTKKIRENWDQEQPVKDIER